MTAPPPPSRAGGPRRRTHLRVAAALLVAVIAVWAVLLGFPSAISRPLWIASVFVLCLALAILAVWRYRLKFSLRSLVTFNLLAACCFALYFSWQPWRRALWLEGVYAVGFSHDGERLVTVDHRGPTKRRLRDLRSGELVGELDEEEGFYGATEQSLEGTVLLWPTSRENLHVRSSRTGREYPLNPSPVAWAGISADGRTVLVWTGEGDRRRLTLTGTEVWRPRRPEQWWGVAYLPESWLAALFAGLLAWSLARDRRSFGAAAAVGGAPGAGAAEAEGDETP